MTFTDCLRLMFFLASCLLASQASAGGPTEISSDRIKSLEVQLIDKPQGFGPTCENRKDWTDHSVVERTAEVRKVAEKLLEQEFPHWDQDLYLEYSRKGMRPNGERMMNARKAWLYPLIIAECVEAKGRYIQAIEKTLTELSDQPTWTWPAHDRSLRNLRDHNYEVDLLAADTAHELAQALYMLAEWISPEVRQRTLSALNERVFDPMKKRFLGQTNDNFWLRADHNWNAVCLKGVVSAALTVMTDKSDRALFAAAAEHYIQRYLSGFGPDGYTSEGPGYWNYGFSHFAALREMLIQSSKGEVDLFRDKNVRNIAMYGYKIEMLPNNIAAFGDASPKTRIDDFTRAYLNDTLGLEQAHHFSSLNPSASQSANDAPLAKAAMLLFSKPIVSEIKAPLDFATPIGLQSYFDSAGVLISRPAKGDKLAISIKAGGNENHSHNDIGSYTIGVGAEQPVGDVGSTQYSAKTFSKDRYTIAAISSWGHPVPVVAGHLQDQADKIKPKVISVQLSDGRDEISINMKDAYSAPEIQSLTRKMVHERVDSGSVTIMDQFEFTKPSNFEVAITTLGKWKQNADGSLELWQRQEHLLARIESSSEWTMRAENSTEEGLSFTRLGIFINSPVKNGFIKVRYQTVPE